jgi:hypothetical protein
MGQKSSFFIAYGEKAKRRSAIPMAVDSLENAQIPLKKSVRIEK